MTDALAKLKICSTEMTLGFRIRGCQQQCGGHNLPPLVGIGLTELPNSGSAKAPPAPPLTTALFVHTFKQEFDLFFWYFYNPNHLSLLKSLDKTLFQSTKFLKHHLMCFAISCCKGDARYFTEVFSPILGSPWAPTCYRIPQQFQRLFRKKAN